MLYQVRLKGKDVEYVQAGDFYREPLSGKIFFKDEDGKNVAMYDGLIVESVNRVTKIESKQMAESWQE